jgi:hypothetical protein
MTVLTRRHLTSRLLKAWKALGGDGLTHAG